MKDGWQEQQPTASEANRSMQNGKYIYLRAALLILAVALAVSGQAAFASDKLDIGLILYGLSLPLSIRALVGTTDTGLRDLEEPCHGQRRKMVSMLLIVLAVICEILILWLDCQGALGNAHAFPLYLLCVALFALSFLVLDGNPLQKLSDNRWEMAGLVAVLVLAFGLQVYRVDTMPPGFWTDEGNDGMEALQVLSGEFPTPFRVDWGATQP